MMEEERRCGMTRVLSLLLASTVPLVFGARAAFAVPYQVEDLAAFHSVEVRGINNDGVLVGYVSALGAFTWSRSAGFVYLAPLPGYDQSYALGINDGGQVVGCSSSPGSDRACLWVNGQPRDLGALPNSYDSQARAINNAGEVVGRSTTARPHAFFWSEAGGMEDISPPGTNDWFQANDINGAGTVVGGCGSGSFIWTRSSGMTTIPASDWTSATAVNNFGEVLLVSWDTAWPGHAWVWQDGVGLTSLPGLPGGDSYVLARDLNNVGQVVGGSTGASGPRSFIWDPANGIRALPSPSGLSPGTAVAINDEGVVAGYAWDNDGECHLLLWTPIPEPCSLLALVSPLAGFGAVVRRRRR
jgi:probable HAF family extracellular repeat protein